MMRQINVTGVSGTYLPRPPRLRQFFTNDEDWYDEEEDVGGMYDEEDDIDKVCMHLCR